MTGNELRRPTVLRFTAQRLGQALGVAACRAGARLRQAPPVHRGAAALERVWTRPPVARLRRAAQSLWRLVPAEQRRAMAIDLACAAPLIVPGVALALIADRRQRRDARLRQLARSHALTRWVFLRCLGGVYLCAFASLWPQLPGLIGQRGILPAAELLDAVRQTTGRERYWQLPTLFWWRADDRTLRGVCALGIGAAVLLIGDVLPGPMLLLLWLCYLSFVTVGQEFLSYQWDALLLESGFLAIFFAPWRWRPGLSRAPLPPRLLVWLYRWLLFRLMFSSGYVKLASGDPTWHARTALAYHYETQPLPTPPAWYLHQLPAWYHRWETGVALALELLVPYGALGPRAARLATALLTAALMAAIQFTGNYGFFNLLTAVLCLPLLDDAWLVALLPRHWRVRLGTAMLRTLPARQSDWSVLPVALLILGLSGFYLRLMVVRRRALPWPERLRMVASRWLPAHITAAAQRLRRVPTMLLPWHLVNTYGLFAVMTTSRPEIIVQGSRDGTHWLDYRFRYKPGDLRRPPRWNAPHQPRLDWQMWFAALRGPWGPAWFTRFLLRLLEGSPEVVRLLEDNPFPDAPPRYVRALWYDYHFSDRALRRETGAWWRRELIGLYFPPAALPERAAQQQPPGR